MKTLEFKIKVDSETGKVVTLKKEFDGLVNTVTKTSNNLNRFTAHISKMINISARLYVADKAFETLKTTIKETVVAGIELNKTLEDAKNGIAALITANTTGGSAFNRFNIAVKMSGDILNKLRLASIKTAATFPELTDIFQNSIGDAISAGKSFGKDLDSIINNTIKLDQRISNIANAIGMPMWQVNQEIRSILEGTVTADSRIAKMLGITNEEINKAKQKAGGLVEYLNQKLAAFDVLANTKTLSKAFARVKETIDNIKIAATKPMFNDLKKDLNDINNWLQENGSSIASFLDNAYFATKKLLEEINKITKPFQVMIKIVWKITGGFIKWILSLKEVKSTLKDIDSLLDKSVKGWNLFYKQFNNMFAKKQPPPSFMPYFDKFQLDRMIHTANLLLEEIPHTTNKKLKAGYFKALKEELKNILQVQSFYADKLNDKQFKAIDKIITKSNKLYPLYKKISKETKKTAGNSLKLGNNADKITLTLEKQQNLYDQIHSLYVAALPKQQQLNEWKKQELEKINQITDKTLKQKALEELKIAYETKKVNLLNKQNKIYDEQYSKAQKLYQSLKKDQADKLTLLKQEYKQNELILKQALKGKKQQEALNLLKSKYQKDINKEKQNELGFDDNTYKMYTDVSKKFGKSSAKVFVAGVTALLKSSNWKEFFTNLGKGIAKSSKGFWGGLAGFMVQHTGELLSYMFDKQYKHIKDKYTGLIDNFNQQSRDYSFRSNAYNAFGQEGYGQAAKLKSEQAGILANQETYKMDYELMKRSKGYKQVIQHTLEAGSIALGTAAAAYFDGGAVLQGLNMAVNAKKWADQATGFKHYQQAFIESVNKLKESIRQFANDLINLAGSVYKNIKDYRSLYDKLTGTNTYKLQQEKEALELVGKYTKLTKSGVAGLIQKILKGSADFVNEAVATTQNVDKLMHTKVLDKYKLSITALNSKFKESVSLVANLLNKQKEANTAISNYIVTLKQQTGTVTNEDYASSQSDAANAIKDYKAGKIDYNDMLNKVKAYQSLAGIRSDKKIIKALEGIKKVTATEYIKNILQSNNGAMPLPSTQVDTLSDPQIQTLNVIKDTKSIIEHLGDLLNFGFASEIKILQKILDVLRNIFGAIWGAVSTLIKDMFKGLSNLEKTIVNAIIKAVKSVLSADLKGISSVSRHIPIIGHSVSHVFKHFHFAEGGYTGSGSYTDQTGEKVAGIVHANEWVAPKWMVKKYSSLFNMLENVRNGGQLQLPIIATQPVNAINVSVDIEEIKTTNEILKEQYIVQKKMFNLLQKFDEEGIKCVS